MVQWEIILINIPDVFPVAAYKSSVEDVEKPDALFFVSYCYAKKVLFI